MRGAHPTQLKFLYYFAMSHVESASAACMPGEAHEYWLLAHCGRLSNHRECYIYLRTPIRRSFARTKALIAVLNGAATPSGFAATGMAPLIASISDILPAM